MSHPTREEWMSFLYEEPASAETKRLASHLKSCEACQREVAGYRGAMAALDQWQLLARQKSAAPQPWMRWAVAASLLLAAGVSIGAAIRPKPDLVAIREAIEPQIKASIQRDLQSQALAQAEQIEKTKRLISQLTQTMSESRAQDQAALVQLRKDLETVATLTEESLQNAQSQLVRLASYTTTE